ncbi:MAG: ABC transporter permease, partial [Alphaproteobacteria bacterium]|nr:ABC transporter permease [Alphaproteobacteria bacterium]
MYQIALKMLLGDRAKYLTLLTGLAFSTLLIIQQASIFCGLMLWTTGTILNINVPVWVMDPKVAQVEDPKPMRDTDLTLVRSVAGVDWAVPLFHGVAQVRLPDGSFQGSLMMGLDQNTLIGAPPELKAGKLFDLYQNNAIFIDEFGQRLLSRQAGRQIGVGDVLEINDREARIVGVVHAYPTFLSETYIFTTYERALQYAPSSRKMLSYVLVSPQAGTSPAELAQRIQQQTGLKARSNDAFWWETIDWYMANTGIPISFGTTVLLGIVVGIAVSGQTFYAFVWENLKNFAALKAMGLSDSKLTAMVLLQA